MLHQRLRDDWLARLRNGPIDPVPRFAGQGIILGAGTVLLVCDGGRRLQRVKGQEARLLALLSAACGEVLPRSVAGHIERAAKSWGEGDDCLAYIHLAHARLPAPRDVHASACRLLAAEKAMTAGVAPQIILQALKARDADLDSVEKFDPGEPRVPAGSGRTSGEWTRDGDGAKPSLLSYLAPGAASWLGELAPSAATSLGEYALSLLSGAGGAVAVFGLLFIPSPNKIQIEGEVEGIPGLRYSWNRDEALLHLKYDDPDGGQRTLALNVDGDFIRDENGKVVGRIIGGNGIAIDTLAVLPNLVEQNEPRLCPAYAPDVPGSDQGKEYEENRSRQYEDFVKRLINPPPDEPTPSGFVYYLPLPKGGEQSYDDCENTTGILFEIKGEGLAKLTEDLPDAMAWKFTNQATRQIDASGGRPVVWIFAEKEAALFARELFDDTPGLKGITVAYVPWIRSGR